MKVKAGSTATIRILYNGQIIFETTFDKILKMFPTVATFELEKDFEIEVQQQ